MAQRDASRRLSRIASVSGGVNSIIIIIVNGLRLWQTVADSVSTARRDSTQPRSNWVVLGGVIGD